MQNTSFKRNCPQCGKDIFYASEDSFRHADPTCQCRYCANVLRGKSSNRKGCSHSEESKSAISLAQMGKKKSLSTRLKMSTFQIKRYSNPKELQKMTNAVTLAMHRPEVRKRHLKALAKTKWLKVKTDNGQLELLEKWNRLGFQFQPNFQVHSDGFLAYIDGYDSPNKVVLEYDSKYHNIIGRKENDLIRQQKIIDILRPKKFWRYDSVTKTVRNVLEEV